MRMTPYHARYYAMLLTRRAGQGQVERYLPALLSANIDLHPHQIEAALFAGRSQFRDGVILADEESLGKTIEAGIVLLQAAFENRNRLLVLCPNRPGNLLPHWKSELRDKFSLDCIGLEELDSKDGVVLLTYQDAYKNAAALSQIRWDLCVLDDAHLLANAMLSDHVISDAIRVALTGCPKLLLTAVPMQNSLLDLYYLIRFVDETAFGSDPEVFRARYMGNKPLKQELASRAQLICQRTLKSQALTIRLPRRTARTVLVPPTPEEDALSKRMSLYFHRENLAAFPKVQEHRIRLTFWKLMASSPTALLDSLKKVIKRLEVIPDAEEERRDLQEVAEMAAGIQDTARSAAFLAALRDVMRTLQEAGAPQKAVIFSEYRQTVSYLYDLLSKHGYRDKIAVYSGGAGGEKALEAFKGKARILLTTDGAGAGLNLTHCACVVNYDLPWNVQRLEKRISCCHWYGQTHDVLVLNFLDPFNRADKRLYTLLNKKLKAFDDVFGASETVLGSVGQAGEASPDARTAEEIQAELALFEEENRGEIERRTKQAEADLLAHFDDEVQARFKRYGETVPEALSQMEYWLWEITKYKLQNTAQFNDETKTIIIHKSPYKGFRLSRLSFGMDKSLPRGERYRPDHPLAKRVLDDCLEGTLTNGTVLLKAGGAFQSGMSGELGLWRFYMASGTDYQANPLLCGYINGGGALSHEDCAKLMKLPPLSYTGGNTWRPGDVLYEPDKSYWNGRLESVRDEAFAAMRERITREQDAALSEELDKLRRWAEDEAAALGRRQEELSAQMDAIKEQARDTADFAERFRLNKELADLEKRRRAEEERLFYLGAEIQQKRDALMAAAREKGRLRFWDMELFVVKWRIE